MRARYNVFDVDVNGKHRMGNFKRFSELPLSAASMPTTYTIAELAREFDITARAIRFYEDQGLLSPSREGVGGRSRVYTPRDRTRLKLTLRGKRLGLTLSDIKSIVDMYESPKDTTAQIDRFLGVLAHQRETLEQQRADIEMALEEIAAHEEECRRLLAEGQDAPDSASKAA
jgi:DNA-binding transcriptional MerR regulator